MATHTSIGSGLWSAAGTWDAAGVPVDNGVVVIALTHVVEFDVDQSGFANGIAGITVTGTLKLTRTAGTYYMKIKAATTIAGAGTFNCGASGDAIPFAAKHTITGEAAWYINGAGVLTMTVYAAEPSIKTILLTGTEAIGSTVLDVDTNVTGDIWAVGDTIRVDDINQDYESEERVIAAGGIAAGTITITAGLTAAKSAGAVVSLITRNVRFIGNGTYLANTINNGRLTIAGGEFRNPSYTMFNGCQACTISGGTFSGTSSAVVATQGYACTITGGVFSGNIGVVSSSLGSTISGGSFSGNYSILSSSLGCMILGGVFKGNRYPVITGVGLFIYGGAFSNNLISVYRTSFVGKNATFSANGNDIEGSIFTLFNVLLGSSIENANYGVLAKSVYSESIDHDQVAGAFKAWTKGGVTSSQTATPPTGYTQYNQTVLENATNEGYWQKEFTVGPGASINFDLWLRKSASMTYLPRVIVFNKAATDPFAGGAGIHTFTMTNSVDTWENEVYIYTNTGAADVTLVIRFQGMNASGNMLSALTATQINVDLTILTANVAVIDSNVDALLVGMRNIPVFVMSK